MKYQDGERLAAWLMKNNPALFTALARQSESRAQLSGITDFFSSLGTGIATATTQVGSFLTSGDGMKALAGLGTIYMQTKAQKDALNLQVKLAQAGQPMAPVAMTTDPYGGTQPYYYPPNGGPPQLMSSRLAQQLAPPFSLATYLPYVAIAGGLGLLIYALRR